MIDKIICGDAYTVLKDLPDNFVDCVVTSPPFYNLRREVPESDHEIGTEADMGDYLANLFIVFDQIHRVLKPTGTVFLEIGDSYGTGYGEPHKSKRKPSENYQFGKQPIKGYNKSLLGIPFRLVTLLISDGGYKLRNTIIWKKPNAMPDSARDRYTNNFTYVFFLVKSDHYYFNQQFEPYQSSYTNYIYKGKDTKDYSTAKAQSPSESKKRILKSMMSGPGRNKRCVWDINSKPHKGAHTSTFPEELVEQCLDAGCPQDGVVLDPFTGSGTTCAVAKRTGRHFVGIDLSDEHCTYAGKRING